MTLDEAINHTLEKAGECAEEHKQLAEWLIELKAFREGSNDRNYKAMGQY